MLLLLGYHGWGRGAAKLRHPDWDTGGGWAAVPRSCVTVKVLRCSAEVATADIPWGAPLRCREVAPPRWDCHWSCGAARLRTAIGILWGGIQDLDSEIQDLDSEIQDLDSRIQDM